MRGLKTIIFLFISNTFMTFAWYGHLKFKQYNWFNNLGLVSIIFISWGIALFEYSFQVPANRIGYGRFSGYQLKVIQECITLVVFAVFAYFYLGEPMRWNYALSFLCVLAAVGFAFWGKF